MYVWMRVCVLASMCAKAKGSTPAAPEKFNSCLLLDRRNVPLFREGFSPTDVHRMLPTQHLP